MNVQTILNLLDAVTPIDWVDRHGNHTLHSDLVPHNWNVTKLWVDSDGFLVIHVDGDFNTL